MEITLEKIELVKDRTGVSYKEAKEALEESNGSVVDAIIGIEETIDLKSRSKVGEQGALVIETIKEAVRKGNVSKIVIKKNNDVILNLPVNIGLIGTILAPWAAVAGVIAVFGTKCQIELIKDNGEVVDISEYANGKLETVKEKSSVIADEMVGKSADVFANVKSKATDAINKVKRDDMEDDDDFNDCFCDCSSEEECDDSCCGQDSEDNVVSFEKDRHTEE